MFKRITLLRRRPGDASAAFQAHWAKVHSSFVLALPGIRRYVQNDVITSPPAAPYDGIVELWFDDEPALRAAFGSEAGRALPGDEANFVGGKIVSDVEERVIVAGQPGTGTAKLISLVRSVQMADPHAWDRWHADLCDSHSQCDGLIRMAHHRVAMQRHIGSEASGPRDINGFIVYHFRDGVSREAFLQGPCDRVERIAADPGAIHLRIVVTERVLTDRAAAR